MLNYGLPPVVYQDAYYSNETDVPDRPREYAGREFRLESTTLPFLPDFDATGTSLAAAGAKFPVVRDKNKEELLYNRKRKKCSLRNWEIAAQPPTAAEVEKWIAEEDESREDPSKLDTTTAPPKPAKELSQIDGPTQKNKGGFKYSQKKKVDQCRARNTVHEHHEPRSTCQYTQ